MNKTGRYIKKSAKRARQNHLMVHDCPVFLNNTDHLPEHIDLQGVIDKINLLIPSHLCKDLDIIYVGHFSFFDETDTNAAYQSGAIYVSNVQDNNEDMLDDIIHEIAHCVEATYPTQIYADGDLEDDFLMRRNRLRSILKSRDYDVDKYDFLNPEYDSDFDTFLYEVVGYERLTSLARDLFPSVYGATSLKEYWATGFEEYFIGDKKDLFLTSKLLYNKVNELANYQE